MASSTPKQSLSFFFFFFLLIIISSSLQIHARDSHFFSKVSSKDDTTPQLTPTNTLNKDETHTPTTTTPTTINNQQQNPNFIPDTENSDGAYGLYGHESGQFPPSSTTTTTNDENQELYPTQGLPSYYNKVAYMTPIHSTNMQYNGDNTVYNPQKQDFGEARFTETQYTTTNPSNNNNMYNMYNGYNNNYNDKSMMYNSEKQGMRGYNSMPTYNGGNMYNIEKQGMSDTRFLENGKYFYDINSENNYNSNTNGNGNRGGYYGNYNNNRMNAYNYENNADGAGYQNQGQYYQENQEDQYIP